MQYWVEQMASNTQVSDQLHLGYLNTTRKQILLF